MSPFSQVSEVPQLLKSSRVNRKLINIPTLSKFRKKKPFPSHQGYYSGTRYLALPKSVARDLVVNEYSDR